MKRFDISACAISIATAMVTTIRSGDDYGRMAQLSKAEGYDKVSDWIAKNAVSQSIALASHLEQARVECPELFVGMDELLPVNHAVKNSHTPFEKVAAPDNPVIVKNESAVGKSVSIANPNPSIPTISPSVGNVSATDAQAQDLSTGSTATKNAENAADQDWQIDAAEVFGGKSADTAAETVAPPTSVTASIAPEPEKNDIPLVPAPPAGVPAATTSTNTTTGSVTPAGVELDSEGIPWDGRIHSSSKKKLVENGRWKLIRGIDKDYVDEIKAELLSGLAAPVPAPVEPSQTQGLHPDPNPLSVAAVNHAIANAPKPPVSEQMGKPAPAATTGTPAVVDAGPQISNFAQLMAAITSAGLKPDQINPVIQSLGIAAMPVLATRPDLIPAVALALGL